MIFKQLLHYQKIYLRRYIYVCIFAQATIKTNLMKEIEKLIAKYEAQIKQTKELRDKEARFFEQTCLTQEVITLQNVVIDLYTSIFNLQTKN